MKDENSRLQFGQDEAPVQEEYEDSDEHEQEDQPENEDSSEHESDASSEENAEEDSHYQTQERKDDGKKPKRDKAQTRINQLQREKYRALHELEQAKAQIESLRQQKEAVSEAGVRQYENNVSSRLEKARNAQIAAIESGDAQAQADANIELASATNEFHELNNWKRQYEYERANQSQRQPQSYIPTPEHNAEVLQDWMDDNDWFNPNSERYDQELSQHINHCANQLDAHLINEGHGDKIRNSDYFAWIDALKDEYIQQRQYAQRGQNYQPQRRDLNMRVDRGRGASPVRGGQGVYSNQRRSGGDSGLSPAEKEMAALCRVSEESYRKQKEFDQRNNPHKRGGY